MIEETKRGECVLDPDESVELERLKTELLDFVMEQLLKRAAEGKMPELTGLLAEAIDKRVNEAISERLNRDELPDPHKFLRDVLAAAAAQAPRGRRRVGGDGSKDEQDTQPESRSARVVVFLRARWTALKWALKWTIAVAVLIGFIFLYMYVRDRNETAQERTNVIFLSENEAFGDGNNQTENVAENEVGNAAESPGITAAEPSGGAAPPRRQ